MKIDAYNCELYRFKVGSFFETQCRATLVWEFPKKRKWLLVLLVHHYYNGRNNCVPLLPQYSVFVCCFCGARIDCDLIGQSQCRPHTHIHCGANKNATFSFYRTKSTRSQAVPRIADRTASQHLSGSRDVIGHMTIWYPVCHFLLVVLWNESLSPAVFEILRSKPIGVTSLTFHGHMTSSVTWPFDSP